jgi:sorbitol-specific phosphotransferase system component IIC
MNTLLEDVLLANIYLQPIQFVLVITTNLLNICILSSRALRLSPCTYYFLAYAIFSINYSFLVCPTQFLRGFSIDWANTRIGCKMHFYFLFLAPVQAKIMLLLASFDRYCSSSQSRQLHSKSTIQKAKLNILIGSISIAIYMSPMLIIYYWDESSKKCLQQSNIFIHIYVLSQVIFYYILTSILMIIFGLLTIVNIHQQSIRAKILTTSIRRRTEGQLARMLILQVSVHLILVIPFGVTYCMNAFDPSTRTSNVLAVRYLLVIWQQCDYFVSFFLYVLSGRVYREEFFRLCNRSFIYRQKLVRNEFSLVRTDVSSSMTRNDV